MLFTEWLVVLRTSFQDLAYNLIGFLPRFLIAILTFVIGWVVGAALGKIIAQVVRSAKLDNLLRSIGVEEAVSKAGMRLDSGAFLGGLVKWFVIIAFLFASTDVLGLGQVTSFLGQVVSNFLPNLVIAALILVVAAVLAQFVQRTIAGSAKAADLPSANFLGGVARWAIWIFAIIAALQQLEIADSVTGVILQGIVYMLTIAGGIAFGLGGKDAAARFIERMRDEISSK